jgi:site-specific DNA-methyltransferase (cytosine-N4-specific)
LIRNRQETSLGKFFEGKVEDFLESRLGAQLRGKVQLILTSPPFPLNNKKSYGNPDVRQYQRWLTDFAPAFSQLLTPDGSIAIEIGNAWEPGRPTQSLLPVQSLIQFIQHPKGNLRLCQEFVCYNPSRLPSPAQWVTVKRIRMTDSYTRIWWMAKTDFPKANNNKVLRPYSESMRLLLKRGSYNSGKRPSEHNIGKKSFLKKNRGSIMPNFIELEQLDPRRKPRMPNALSISNTNSNDALLRSPSDARSATFTTTPSGQIHN